MSRNLTTAYKVAVTAGTVTPIILVTAEFDSETLRFWNGIGPFVYAGDTYTGAGNLLKITDVVETQNTEAQGAQFTLSGIPTALLATALAEDYQDRKVTQRFCPLDADGNVIADPFMFFSGKADVMTIEDGATYSTIALTAENDLIALQRQNERRRTPQDQKLLYPDDSFFDQVSTLQSVDVVWGKNG